MEPINSSPKNKGRRGSSQRTEHTPLLSGHGRSDEDMLRSSNEELSNRSAHSSARNVWQAIIDGRDMGRDERSDEGLNYLRLEERRTKLSALFGVKPYAGTVSTAASRATHEKRRHLYAKPNAELPLGEVRLCNVGNVLWTLFFGWWLALAYCLSGILLAMTFFGIPHAKLCFSLAQYFFWPFGKYLVCRRHKVDTHVAKRGLWYFFSFIPVLSHCAVFIVTWYAIVFIPMAKVNREAIRLIYTRGLDIEVCKNTNGREILLCSHHAVNFGYVKYSVFDGFNVLMTNLSVLSLVDVFFGMGCRFTTAIPKLPDMLLFILSLSSMIPLAYFVGMAIGRISAQSTPAFGAFLNATFGSLVDLILYCSAIVSGELDVMVKASVVGSLLLCLLFFPGMSMIAGGFKYSEQHFNFLAAGVTSELLLVSVMGALTPTIFYHTYGNYELVCDACDEPSRRGSYDLDCSNCHFAQTEPQFDNMYKSSVIPLMYVCAAMLPLAYGIGLLFTLKTHAKHIYVKEDDEEEAELHDSGGAPQWSRAKSFVVLISATVIFGLVAEVLVDATGPTIDQLGVSQRFVGVTIIAFVPSITEFINSIKFALQDNIALSVEVAASYSVQITLLQIPTLVFFSAVLSYINDTEVPQGFSLIFDGLDVFAVLLSVIVVNYAFTSPRTNYFEGASLVIIYIIIVTAYFFAPENGVDVPAKPLNGTMVVNMQ